RDRLAVFGLHFREEILMMLAMRGAGRWSLILAMVLVVWIPARGGGGQPLSEATLTKLIELPIDDGAIASKLRKEGIGLAVDAAMVRRLKRAGASDAVIAAVRA